MSFAVRVLVTAAIMSAFYMVRGRGSIVETFAVALVAVAASHLVVRGLQLGRAKADVSPGRRGLAAAAIGLVVVGAAVSAAVAFTAIPRPTAYLTVPEVMADPAAAVGRELRLHGYLGRGTLRSQVIDQRMSYSFALVEHQQRIAARFTGVAPTTFAERAEVIATGRVARAADGSYVFEATDVIAKCPSTYQTPAGPVPASRFR
jgi:cytochrome c-type biogenesis protein CcmE